MTDQSAPIRSAPDRPTPIVCAIYARVSDESQAKGDSIAHQISFCQAYASRRGREEGDRWETSPKWIYVDSGISGTSLLGRAAVQQLITDAKQQSFRIVLFKGISRFARDTMDALLLLRTLTACGVRIISMEENFDSLHQGAEFLFTIHSALAQAESEKTAIRVRMGAMEKAKQGKWNGQPPMGYRLDAYSQKLIVDPNTAPLIQHLFAQYLTGHGCRAIAERLNQRGCFTQSGHLWSARQVARVLKNPVYAGDVVYGRTEQQPVIPDGTNLYVRKWRAAPTKHAGDVVMTRDAHPALIDRQTFSRVQVQLASNQPRSGRRGHAFLFTKGLLRCQCNSSMTIKYNGRGEAYYRCIRQQSHGRTACSAPYLRADDVDTLVLRHLRPEVDTLMHANAQMLQQTTARRTAPPNHDLHAAVTQLLTASKHHRDLTKWLISHLIHHVSLTEYRDDSAELCITYRFARPRDTSR